MMKRFPVRPFFLVVVLGLAGLPVLNAAGPSVDQFRLVNEAGRLRAHSQRIAKISFAAPGGDGAAGRADLAESSIAIFEKALGVVEAASLPCHRVVPAWRARDLAPVDAIRMEWPAYRAAARGLLAAGSTPPDADGFFAASERILRQADALTTNLDLRLRLVDRFRLILGTALALLMLAALLADRMMIVRPALAALREGTAILERLRREARLLPGRPDGPGASGGREAADAPDGAARLVALLHESATAAARDARFAAALLDELPDGVVALAPGGEVLLVNRAAGRFIAPPAGGEAPAVDPLVPLPEPGGTIQYRCRADPAADEAIYDVRAGAIELPGGPVRLLTLRDVTDRMGRLAALEAADQAKRLFLARMSHELRTPLQAILGFADLLLLDQPPASRASGAADAAGRIAASARHLAALVDDILDVAKIDAGTFELRTAQVDPAGVVAEAVELMRGVAGGGVRIGFARPPRPLVLRCDAGRVRQVVINLVSNAVRHSPPGGRVDVRLFLAGDRARVEVEDDGPGVPAPERTRIFDEFHQAPGSPVRHLGLGIGLALSRRIVELHEGTIGVEEPPGRGSRFWFELPGAAERGDARPGGPPHAGEPGAPPHAPGARRTARRVLVAEDDDMVANMIVAMLRGRGYVVERARDGAEAVERFTAFRPAIVLMDLRMPRMDGFEATRRIRGEPDGATVTVLAVTAEADADSRRLALAAGCAAVLAKPFRAPELLAMLDRFGIES